MVMRDRGREQGSNVFNDAVLLDFASLIVSRIERWIVDDPAFLEAFGELRSRIAHGDRFIDRESMDMFENMCGTLAFVDFKSNFNFMKVLCDNSGLFFNMFVEKVVRDKLNDDKYRAIEIVRSRFAFILSLNMFGEMMSQSRIERLKRYLSNA